MIIEQERPYAGSLLTAAPQYVCLYATRLMSVIILYFAFFYSQHFFFVSIYLSLFLHVRIVCVCLHVLSLNELTCIDSDTKHFRQENAQNVILLYAALFYYEYTMGSSVASGQ